MSKPPKLSILALCYNHASFLEDALQSIANLEYPNLEVLVADDASTDGSPNILNTWKNKQPGWKFLLKHTNEGNCKTFNDLLALATGEYIIDFATDDMLVKDNISGWVSYLGQNPDAAFCYADAWTFGSGIAKPYLHSQTLKNQNFPEGLILNALFTPAFICPPAVLFRKAALEAIGGYDETLAYEDWDVWLRLARRFRVCRYALPVIWYRKHADSMSASILTKRNHRHIDSTIQILERVWEWPETDPRAAFSFLNYHLKITALMQMEEQANFFYQKICLIKQDKLQHWFWWKLSGWHMLPVKQIFSGLMAIRKRTT